MEDDDDDLSSSMISEDNSTKRRKKEAGIKMKTESAPEVDTEGMTKEEKRHYENVE